jgi:hypothetical protein
MKATNSKANSVRGHAAWQDRYVFRNNLLGIARKMWLAPIGHSDFKHFRLESTGRAAVGRIRSKRMSRAQGEGIEATCTIIALSCKYKNRRTTRVRMCLLRIT